MSYNASNEIVLTIQKLVLWEQAKGYLMAVKQVGVPGLHTKTNAEYIAKHERWCKMDQLIEKFISDMEDEGYHEMI